MTYGIGRVPRDVDPTDEVMAELEAAEIMANQTHQEQLERDRAAGYGQCCASISSPYVQCPNRLTNPAIYNSHTPGCAVMCEAHWLEYHKRSGSTVAEVLEAYRQQREWDRQHPPKCTRCGKPGAWNSGAGMALCERHWDEY